YVFANDIITLTIVTALLFAVQPGFYISCGNIAGEIPHHIQGRVASITRSGDFLSYSAGLFIVGLTLQFLGNGWTIAILTALLLVLSLAATAQKLIFRSALSGL